MNLNDLPDLTTTDVSQQTLVGELESQPSKLKQTLLFSEFATKQLGSAPLLIDPWLPREGVIMFHAPSGKGKSPLGWHIGRCVSDGTPFFGYPVKQSGPVLWIECDTPDILMQPRIQLFDPMPKQFYYLNYYPGFDVAEVYGSKLEELKIANLELNPVLVIFNTLRKITQLDLSQGDTVEKVYQAIHRIFPKAAKLVIHHDKKSGNDPNMPGDPDQAFNGSNSWRDDAQTTWHLTDTDRKHRKLKLEQTKCQYAKEADPLRLQLHENGTVWIDQTHEEVYKVFLEFGEKLPKMERYKMTAERLGISQKTVQRAVSAMVEKLNERPQAQPLTPSLNRVMHLG